MLPPTAFSADLHTLWVRGGFPLFWLAPDDVASLRWREAFIATYLERDIPVLGPRIPATTLRRLWTMLAHTQGGLLNQSQLASNAGPRKRYYSGATTPFVGAIIPRVSFPVIRTMGRTSETNIA